MADVPVIAPDGTPGTIPAEQLEVAQGQGYRVDSAALAQQQAAEAEAARYDSPLLAGAAGAARGLTFGLSDAAAVGSGLVDRSTLRGLEEHNPTASTLGEIGGALLPALATEGGSAAGEAGLLAKAKGLVSAPTRLLGEVAGGAGELGGELGLGRTAQAAVRGAVEGATYQAGNNLSEAVIQDKPLTAQALFHDVASSALLGGGVGATVDKLLGAVAERLPPALERAQASLDALGERAELGAASGPALRAAERDLDAVAEHLGEAMPARVRQILQDAPPVPQLGEAVGGLRHVIPDLPPAAVESLVRGADDIARAPDLAAQHEALAALAERLGEAPMAQRAVQRALEAPAFGPAAEYVRGVDAALAPARSARTAIDAATTPEARQAAVEGWREAARDAIANLQESTYRHVSGRPVSLDALAEHVHALEGGTGEAPRLSLLEQFGKVAGMLPGGHHVAAPLHAMAALGEVATMFRGGQSETVAKLTRRAAAAVQSIRTGVEAALTGTARTKAGRAAVAALSGRQQSPTAVGARMARVADLADPARVQALMAQQAPRSAQHAPQVIAELTATAMRATQYLAAQAPRDPRPPSPVAQPAWVPSATEAQRWAQIERATLRPLSLVEDFRALRLTPETVDAVRTVHPDLYARIVATAGEAIASRSKPPSYSAQLQLDLLLGRPVSPAGLTGPMPSSQQPPAPRPPAPTPAPNVASQQALKGSPLQA